MSLLRLGYKRLTFLAAPHPSLPVPVLSLSPSPPSLSLPASLSLSLSLPAASCSSHGSLLMKEAAMLGLPVDAHRKKRRPSVLQPMRNRGLPATTHLSGKQINPPPAESAGEMAAPSDT